MHIATKLARHFIADDPPPTAVARIARAFRDSDGHLPTVHAALLDGPGFSSEVEALHGVFLRRVADLMAS